MGNHNAFVNEGLDGFSDIKPGAAIHIIGEFIFEKILPECISVMQLAGGKPEGIFLKDCHCGVCRRNEKGNTIVFVIFKGKPSVFIDQIMFFSIFFLFIFVDPFDEFSLAI